MNMGGVAVVTAAVVAVLGTDTHGLRYALSQRVGDLSRVSEGELRVLGHLGCTALSREGGLKVDPWVGVERECPAAVSNQIWHAKQKLTILTSLSLDPRSCRARVWQP